MKYSLIIAIAFAFIRLNNPVFAQDTTPQKTVGDREVSLGLGIPATIDFHGYIGLATGVFPDYQGSDDVSAVVLPLVDIRQEDFLFIRGASVNPNDGYGSMGWNALNFGYDERGERKLALSFGPMIRFSAGRDEDDNSALIGLGDIDDSAALGGFIEVRAGNWSADVSTVSQDAGDAGDGLLVAFRSSYTAQISERFSITPTVFASWGDDDYMQGFYGVNSAQAMRSGATQFNAESGFKDVGFQIGMTYSLFENFLINGQIGYQQLLNDAADSPIVDSSNRSRDQIRVLFGMAYKF